MYTSRLIQGSVPIPDNYDEKQGLISTTSSASPAVSKKQKNMHNAGGGSGGSSSSTLATDSSSVSFFEGKKKEANGGDGDDNSDCSSVASAHSTPGTAKEKSRSKSVKKAPAVGFFPSISGASGGNGMLTSSSKGFLNKITGGLFGQKDESKKGVAGGGGTRDREGSELLPLVNQEGMSQRLVNSTRIKVPISIPTYPARTSTHQHAYQQTNIPFSPVTSHLLTHPSHLPTHPITINTFYQPTLSPTHARTDAPFQCPYLLLTHPLTHHIHSHKTTINALFEMHQTTNNARWKSIYKRYKGW